MLRHKALKVRGRIWIESNELPFLGLGRIELLKKIKEFGSITQASKAMKMSYRQAWQMIESMNQESKMPLVIKQSGGKGGGGALLTESGMEAIDVFTNLREEFFEFLQEKSKKLKL